MNWKKLGYTFEDACEKRSSLNATQTSELNIIFRVNVISNFYSKHEEGQKNRFGSLEKIELARKIIAK